jgi:hypothetical protein
MRTAWKKSTRCFRCFRSLLPSICSGRVCRLRRSSPEIRKPNEGSDLRESLGTRISIHNLLNRLILPAFNRCQHCGLNDGKKHLKQEHDFQRDQALPVWQGWHAARRGLGANLYRLGVPDKVIQTILRHSNVNVTIGITSSHRLQM